MCQKDGKLTEEGMKAFTDALNTGLSENDVHDMFVVGGGKDGFTLESWLKAFEHKDHGDQDDELSAAFECVSSGGALNMDVCAKIIAMAGLELKPKEFDEFKKIADYNSDGKVDMADFTSMI